MEAWWEKPIGNQLPARILTTRYRGCCGDQGLRSRCILELGHAGLCSDHPSYGSSGTDSEHSEGH